MGRHKHNHNRAKASSTAASQQEQNLPPCVCCGKPVEEQKGEDAFRCESCVSQKKTKLLSLPCGYVDGCDVKITFTKGFVHLPHETFDKSAASLHALCEYHEAIEQDGYSICTQCKNTDHSVSRLAPPNKTLCSYCEYKKKEETPKTGQLDGYTTAQYPKNHSGNPNKKNCVNCKTYGDVEQVHKTESSGILPSGCFEYEKIHEFYCSNCERYFSEVDKKTMTPQEYR